MSIQQYPIHGGWPCTTYLELSALVIIQIDRWPIGLAVYLEQPTEILFTVALGTLATLYLSSELCAFSM